MLGNGKPKNELRRYRRIPVDLPARAIINGIDEYHGNLINMSPGDLAMKIDANVVVGDAAQVYVTGLDMFEGTVARVFPDGFALSFRLSRIRRSLLTEKLMMKVNPKLASQGPERRAAPRFAPGVQRMVCRLPNGSSLFVKVIETSVDGVALEASRKPLVGTDIHVGRMRGVVVRHTPRGFVVVYDHNEKVIEHESAREAG